MITEDENVKLKWYYQSITFAKKYIMELMLHNYDSQVWSVLFWPHKWNIKKYIYI